ncbi:hypothetical protein BMAJHU_0690 [Burkholderia mallei JHU]|nr:hypothetical protein BMAJHU_0690 [Burkholderia mallei JHU]
MRGTGWSAVAQASCQWGACFAANGVNARRARRARKTAKAVGSGLRATAGRPRAPAAGARERRAALRLCARAALVRCANM